GGTGWRRGGGMGSHVGRHGPHGNTGDGVRSLRNAGYWDSQRTQDAPDLTFVCERGCRLGTSSSTRTFPLFWAGEEQPLPLGVARFPGDSALPDSFDRRALGSDSRVEQAVAEGRGAYR